MDGHEKNGTAHRGRTKEMEIKMEQETISLKWISIHLSPNQWARLTPWPSRKGKKSKTLGLKDNTKENAPSGNDLHN